MSGRSTKAAKAELRKHVLLPKGDANHSRRILKLARFKGLPIGEAIAQYSTSLGYKMTTKK